MGFGKLVLISLFLGGFRVTFFIENLDMIDRHDEEFLLFSY